MATKAERAARRDARSGAGPTLDEPAGNPGATSWFGLLGEALYTGVLVTAFGLLVVTLPAALAAGSRHLRRYVRAEGSSFRSFWNDFRRALPGGLGVGAAAAVIAAVLAIDILLAGSGVLPGGSLVAGAGWTLAAVGAGALLASAGLWTPGYGWLRTLRLLPAHIARDIPGFLYVVIAAAFVGLATWMLIPLFVPALGLAALATVAIPARPRRDR
ncbi:DUF624 domain-containing protein [Microbacterium sp. G2-8]|uniref:DUF624 domain-containing protein n=1 Tax=Microbacterium sp. G2-8 TaxID=2842454 RepID=UPI001C8A7341|nr:DUF624 domain-containing protein [Microbacterium sp. G2-8]